MGYHARLSPSGAKRWKTCTASPREELGKPNENNDASRWGTTNHLLSSTSLIEGVNPSDFADWQCIFWDHPESESSGESLLAPNTDPDPSLLIEAVVPIDDEQVECATTFVNFVREMKVTLDAEMHVEQPVPIDHITGETEATGTADCVLLPRQLDTLVVIDLKGGMYRVDAMESETAMVNDDLGMPSIVETRTKPNVQLAMYAAGAVRKFDPHHHYKFVKLIVVQPRLGHVSELTISIAELGETVRELKAAVIKIATAPEYAPSFDICHYCKGKSTCNAFTDIVLENVFEDQSLAKPRDVKVHELGDLFAKLDMIELWCSSIRSVVHKELSEWRPVKGLKLVQGRMGNRKWYDKDRAAQVLSRDLALPERLVFAKKVIGPATAEKLATAKKGTKPILDEFKWTIVQGMISQEQGKPVVVFESDPRPALTSPEAAFTDLSKPST